MARHHLFAAAVALAAGLSANAQTVFKCKDAAGKVSFQQAPCDGHRSGAINVQPMNAVEGRPAGERVLRRDAAQRDRKEELDRWVDDAVQRINNATRLQPCHTELEIRNATLDLNSRTATREQRRTAERREFQMRSCRR